MKKYYEIIRELREDRDYTQKQIADILNTISKFILATKKDLMSFLSVTLLHFAGFIMFPQITFLD